MNTLPTVAERLTRTGRFHLLLRHEHLGAGADGERVRDLAHRRGPRHRRAPKGRGRQVPGGVSSGHPRSSVRGSAIRTSRPCQRPARDSTTEGPSTPSSDQARRRWTPASGSWTTALSQIGSAGSGRATRGSTTVATFSRSTWWPAIIEGICPRCRGRCPGIEHRAISSSVSRTRGGSFVSILLGRQPCTAGPCSAPTSCDAVRQIKDVRQARPMCGGSRPTASCSIAGRLRPDRRSCISTAPRSA